MVDLIGLGFVKSDGVFLNSVFLSLDGQMSKVALVMCLIFWLESIDSSCSF